MKRNILIYISALISTLVFISCAASTGSRYEKAEEKAKNEDEMKTSAKDYEENFDFAPYHSKIEVTEPEAEKSNPEDAEIWYDYPEAETVAGKTNTVVEKRDGYRVQVTSTDNLDEANSIRSDLYFKTNQKNVYVIFDPPFYKVKVGDFLNHSDANNLNFKLTQLGYTESKVVKDSVNVSH